MSADNMALLNGINMDAPSFFSEESIDDWMKSNHEYIGKMRKTLLRLYVPVLAAGFFFALSVSHALSNGSSFTFTFIFIFIMAVIFLILLLMSFNTFFLCCKLWWGEKHGLWFASFKCKCKARWIKALDKKEKEKYSGHVGEKFDTCPSCDARYKLEKMWKKTM